MSADHPEFADLTTLGHAILRLAHTHPDAHTHALTERQRVTTIQATQWDRATHTNTIADPTGNLTTELDRIDRTAQALIDDIGTLWVWLKMANRHEHIAYRLRAQTWLDPDEPETTPLHYDDLPTCPGWEGMPPEQTCHRHPDIRKVGGRTDGRCIDCGRHHDRLQAEREQQRAAEANARRARRHAERNQR